MGGRGGSLRKGGVPTLEETMHPSINVSKFNHEYLTDILTKIKNENKNIILMGDFNVNVINYKNRGIYGFLEQLFNHNFNPQIKLSFLLGLLKKQKH